MVNELCWWSGFFLDWRLVFILGSWIQLSKIRELVVVTKIMSVWQNFTSCFDWQYNVFVVCTWWSKRKDLFRYKYTDVRFPWTARVLVKVSMFCYFTVIAFSWAGNSGNLQLLHCSNQKVLTAIMVLHVT